MGESQLIHVNTAQYSRVLSPDMYLDGSGTLYRKYCDLELLVILMPEVMAECPIRAGPPPSCLHV
jgi:hypothetical protein